VEKEMDVLIEPRAALTGFLEVPGIGPVRLDFLITLESGSLYIRCLDFGIMSCGETVEECQENIQEAILIYLEDLPPGQSLFHPAPAKYWRLFSELRSRWEQRPEWTLSPEQRSALQRQVQ
jgi:hypothetical protein